jgi:hypothetical protein
VSISDALRLREIETSLATLLERVAVLEACQAAKTPVGPAGARDRDPPIQRLSSAPTGDAVAALGKHGGNRKSETAKDQVRDMNLKSSDTATYALRRLKRDHPELADKVVAGELSPHAAAVQAGFRRRRITVPADAGIAGRSGGSR